METRLVDCTIKKMAYVFYQVFYTALVVVAIGYAAMETMDAGPIP